MKKNVIYKFLIYFIVYSIVGFFLETIYAIFTKGMLESRHSFLYGPFCIVYGIAAIIMISILSLYYAVLRGILAIILIKYINPLLDKGINIVTNKISNILLKTVISLITLFMVFDGLFTCYALENFLVRVANEYKMNINGVDSEKIGNIYFEEAFSNEKMMMTYPNMIVVKNNGEIVYLETVLSGIKNYYYKFGSNE